MHPSVAAFARSLLAGTFVSYDGDPLRDLTLTAFLDKFVQRKPKVTPLQCAAFSHKPCVLVCSFVQQVPSCHALQLRKLLMPRVAALYSRYTNELHCLFQQPSGLVDYRTSPHDSDLPLLRCLMC